MQEKNQLDKLFMTKRLPCDEFEQRAHKLVLSSNIRCPLLKYRKLILCRQKYSITDGPLNGFLVFVGEPGAGKTMTGCAFSQAVAKGHFALFGQETDFFQLRASGLFSEMLGKTGQTIAEAFEMIRFSAERRQAILVVDELESLGFSRALLSSGDPTDLVRSVNELLTQLDRLRGCPNFLCIGTTNLNSVLDPALVDRADYIIRFRQPDVEVGRKILLQGAVEAGRMGIHTTKEDLVKVAQALCGEGDGKRASGRLLAKLVLLAYLEGNSNRPTAGEMIEVAKKRLNGQENIYEHNTQTNFNLQQAVHRVGRDTGTNSP